MAKCRSFVNGFVTTTGVTTYTDAAGETVTVNWEKTLDPLNPLAVWTGPGQTADGKAVPQDVVVFHSEVDYKKKRKRV